MLSWQCLTLVDFFGISDGEGTLLTSNIIPVSIHHHSFKCVPLLVSSPHNPSRHPHPPITIIIIISPPPHQPQNIPHPHFDYNTPLKSINTDTIGKPPNMAPSPRHPMVLIVLIAMLLLITNAAVTDWKYDLQLIGHSQYQPLAEFLFTHLPPPIWSRVQVQSQRGPNWADVSNRPSPYDLSYD